MAGRRGSGRLSATRELGGGEGAFAADDEPEEFRGIRHGAEGLGHRGGVGGGGGLGFFGAVLLCSAGMRFPFRETVLLWLALMLLTAIGLHLLW